MSYERAADWWATLDEAQRQRALEIATILPEWLADSLRAAHLVPVEAEVADEHGVLRPVALLPTLVADFLERQRNGGNGTV